MEAELKCAHCREFYRQPVLLPCFHSLCYSCSLHLQEKFTTSSSSTLKSKISNQNQNSNPFANAAKSITAILSSSLSPSSSSSSSSTCDDDSNSQANFSSHSILSDLDKLSMASDSGDSGVITTNNSRPCSSYIQQHTSLPQPQLPPPPPLLPTNSLYSTYLQCPKCERMIYMDDQGVDSLTPNKCLENIVERHIEKLNLTSNTNTNKIKCQMCPLGPSGNEANVMCEQCNIYYCDACRDSFHPMRGPLLKHILVKPLINANQHLLANTKKSIYNQNKCVEHENETISFYCLVCKCVCCSLCVNDTTTHLNHHVQQINGFCKAQKVNV